MADNALIVDSGKALMGRLLRNDGLQGITHCALGTGDDTFTDPENPPTPTPDQALLKSEFIRKTAYRMASPTPRPRTRRTPSAFSSASPTSRPRARSSRKSASSAGTSSTSAA